MVPLDNRTMRTDNFMRVNYNLRYKVGKMSKHRVCTTISSKHWELLKKYTTKFETQQKALEAALENLESDSKQNPAISQEDRFWLQMRELKVLIHIHKDIFLEMVKTADYEKVDKILATYGLAEYMIVFHYQKPIRECSLKEVMDGIVITARAANWLDTINYTDNSDHYTLIATHSVGNIKYSNSFRIFYETLFEVYGVKTQSKISDNSLFMEIYKNL
ncbi:conserved hypothetical protein [Candidatus Methanoperedens nitroreducens]|uniref:Uncharacterized protein n=2 Tax=Candidatus Methanoperedens nitratireducens TaxID=1392998 RepID=A0A284VTC3_9EURY|nr:conserved hypothetical protein [Candidatus Methanoperedens nitroreducens]